MSIFLSEGSNNQMTNFSKSHTITYDHNKIYDATTTDRVTIHVNRMCFSTTVGAVILDFAQYPLFPTTTTSQSKTSPFTQRNSSDPATAGIPLAYRFTSSSRNETIVPAAPALGTAPTHSISPVPATLLVH